MGKGAMIDDLIIRGFSVSILGASLSVKEMTAAMKASKMDIIRENYNFDCEPNRKTKGHVKPFYRKGRW